MMKMLICTLFLLAVAGCGNGRPAPNHYTLNAPAEAPPPPRKQNVPLDSALRELARTELLNATRDSDPVIRANGIEALQDTLGAEASDAILHGLDDADPLVRFAASMAAGKLKLRAAYSRLTELVNDADDNVKVGVRFALHRLGDTRYSHDLERLAHSPTRSVRANTALALGLLGEPSALQGILRGMTADADPVVRLQVAEAMWRLGDQDGLQMLVVGTISGYPDDQIICVLALGEPKDVRVAPHLYGKLTSEYPEVALAAARALGMLGSDAGYAIALKASKNSDPRQKAMAALAFGQIGRSDAQDVLAPLLKDPNQPVKLAAATAILQLKA